MKIILSTEEAHAQLIDERINKALDERSRVYFYESDLEELLRK